jgi:hypothetical protein
VRIIGRKAAIRIAAVLAQMPIDADKPLAQL